MTTALRGLAGAPRAWIGGTPGELVPLVLWSGLASINLAAGLANALREGQSQDLKVVVTWAELWLVDSVNPYVSAGADYPPNALVLFSPLTIVPDDALALCWALFCLVLAPTAVFLAYRTMFPAAPQRAALVAAALFLSWSSVRIGLGVGQFHLVTVALGIAAVVLADRRPYMAGLALGAAFLKPHLAVAFLLWAILTGRLRLATTALCVAGSSALVFALRLGQDPAQVVASYLAVVDSELGVGQRPPGVDLRPLLDAWLGPSFLAIQLQATISAVILVTMIWMSARLRGQPARARDPFLLAVCCAWTILMTPHQSYDAVVLLPVMLWLFAPAGAPRGVGGSPGALRHWLFRLLQLTLVLGVPGSWWKLQNRPNTPPTGLLPFFDTFVLAAILAYLVWHGLAGASWEVRRARPVLHPQVAE